MSTAIADALTAGENLCIEAPTGVGKSFAYLVPLIYRAVHSGRPAVVSTETINLQEQLIDKDLPLLKQLTGINFKAALAKGRHNYLCRRRFAMLSGRTARHAAARRRAGGGCDAARQMDAADHRRRTRFDRLPARTDRLEHGVQRGDQLPRPQMRIFPQLLLLQGAAGVGRCRHRGRESRALFTDLGMRLASGGNGAAGSLLPNYGAVLIDEAHTARGQRGRTPRVHLSRIGIVSTLNRLYNPEAARGLLMRKGADPELRGIVADARDEAYGFFKHFEDFLADHRETALEIQQPDRFPDRLSPHLLKLSKLLTDYLDDIDDASFRTELDAQLVRCREFLNGIDHFTHKTLPDAVYYAESDRNSISLHAAPLNVADILADVLFNQDFPVMLCSATLTVRRSFDYFVNRTGFCNGRTLLLDSPFGSDQAHIYISRGMPDPKDDNFNAALADEIPRFVEVTQGKAFVLFTSYGTLRYCADALRGYFQEKGWQLLIQGENLTRTGLLREFKEDVNSVLFGTDSFWTGVDVPGEALSNVIVTKLPFAVPSHPLIAARMARIERQGKSSFAEYSLPEAVRNSGRERDG